ncbi:MAG: hypothetical protein CMJ84_09640 [Planctomycetes bacterium]|jgi:hypothetical protein|nr:hypothetical protein [Planctomycetota bacterium]
MGAAPGRPDPRRAGFTMMELSLAITVLMVALLAMSASTLHTHSLRRQNRERAVAQNAVRLISEEIQAFSARTLLANPGQWSEDLVAAFEVEGLFGPTFDVTGLGPANGQSAVGSVLVITDEELTDAQLGFELGMPRDLDGDGEADNGDVTEGARILPVVVRLRWKGVSGEVFLNHPFFVIGY